MVKKELKQVQTGIALLQVLKDSIGKHQAKSVGRREIS